MQGQRSSVGSLPELGFHHGSATNDSAIDPQRYWNNNMRIPSQEGQHLSGWNLGETSSSAAREQILSLNNVDPSLNTDQAANGCLFMQTSSSAANPQVHNTNLQFAAPNADEDDDCQVIECIAPGINSSPNPFVTASGSGGYIVEGSDGGSSSSLNGRRLSCKRKTLEGNPGQSSGSGSSNYLQAVDSSLWHAATAHINTAPTVNNFNVNLSEQVHHGLGLSIGGAASEVPVTLSASRSAENARRSFRSRMNASIQQDDSLPATAGGSYNVSSVQRSMRLQPNYNPVQLTPFSVAENRSVQRPTVASLRRNPQTRSNRVSSSVAAGSSSVAAVSNPAISVPYEAVGPNSRSLPRNISEHPMFIPSISMGNSLQNPVNWSLPPVNVNTSGNIASTSRDIPRAPAPTLVPQRNSPNYSRVSDILRRSLMSAVGAELGSENGSYNAIPASSSSQETALPSGSGNLGHHRLLSRALLERHIGGAHGYSPSARALAAATPEGRSRLVSEIRNVLDLMRRGEGLRLEDVMILDQSVLFGLADSQDRHRDMRLDVDNMSYEELLALGERIGDVCTGVNEETISSQLKHRKFISLKTDGQVEVEPCCVCQEEYHDGEDVGTLECGHDFHSECIKQWLKQKNLCPICKTTGLTAK